MLCSSLSLEKSCKSVMLVLPLLLCPSKKRDVIILFGSDGQKSWNEWAKTADTTQKKSVENASKPENVGGHIKTSLTLLIPSSASHESLITSRLIQRLHQTSTGWPTSFVTGLLLHWPFIRVFNTDITTAYISITQKLSEPHWLNGFADQVQGGQLVLLLA